MKIIADANAYFSAFIAAGLTRKLWFDPRLELYAPEFMLEEYRKHQALLAAKSKLSEEDAKRLAELLESKVTLVETRELLPYAKAAESLTTDEKDEPYLACALAIGADIWSHDKHLQQKRVKTWTTKQLAQELEYA